MNIKSYLHSLASFLSRKKISLDNLQKVDLPDAVAYEEDLARNLIGGSSKKSIKKLYNPDTKAIKPSRFLDTRNPRELSVNRISTLTERQAHKLGIEHADEIKRSGNTNSVYHGFAKISVRECLEAGCSEVVKDDYNGSKPYHANIIYPQSEKSDEMEIANVLAFKAVLVKYNTDAIGGVGN